MTERQYLWVEFQHGRWLVIEMAPGRNVTPEKYDAEVRQFINTMEEVVSWTWLSVEEGKAWTLSGILTSWPPVHMVWQTGTCVPLYGGVN